MIKKTIAVITGASGGLGKEFVRILSDKRELDEIFPWDFIDIGVTKEFLKREWNNAMAEKVTPNCRQKCSGCGAAKFGGGVCYESKSKMDENRCS